MTERWLSLERLRVAMNWEHAIMWNYRRIVQVTCFCTCLEVSVDQTLASVRCLTASGSARNNPPTQRQRSSPSWRAFPCPCPTNYRPQLPSAYPTSRCSYCQFYVMWLCWTANRRDDACTPIRLPLSPKGLGACDGCRTSAMPSRRESRDRFRTRVCGSIRWDMTMSLCDWYERKKFRHSAVIKHFAISHLVGKRLLFIGLPEMLRCDDKFVVMWFPLWLLLLLLLCWGDMLFGDWGPEDDWWGLFFHGWKPFPTAASANGGGDLLDNLLHWAASMASGVPFKVGCSWKGNK